MKKIIITVICLTFLLIIYIFTFGGVSFSRDETTEFCPDYLVVNVFFNQDTIYYINPTYDLYSLLNMKILEIDDFKKNIWYDMKHKKAIEVDSLLFCEMEKQKISIVKEVDSIYIKGGIYAVLDNYFTEWNTLRPSIDEKTMCYVIYLSFLNDIYFYYKELDDYVFIDATASDKLTNYRDSIKIKPNR